MGKLNEIGLKYNADKSSRFHHYLDFYQKHLPDRDFKGRLLEIGVMDGLSMKMWREYYPDAEIVGIDIKDMSMFHNTDWQVPESVKLLTLDGTKAKDMRPLGKFDIILDDGSHYMKDQQASFELLYYSQLTDDGVYILEDLWTSHIALYQNAPITTIDFLKKLEAKGMKMSHFKYKHTGPGIETVFPEYKGLDSHTVVIKAGQ
jgi:trans-aconitate methyltransferase